MHIDFAPPSNGTYNNAGGCRQLVNYMEHEDLERIGKGIYTEGFFNLTEDNIYKSTVIKDIDSNIGQLLKTDAKFYAIHVSPSKKELQAMGNTEQEQAEAMNREHQCEHFCTDRQRAERAEHRPAAGHFAGGSGRTGEGYLYPGCLRRPYCREIHRCQAQGMA